MNAPITALWAGALGLLSLVLAALVVRVRIAHKVDLGTGGHLLLEQRIRVYGNFIEYVPIALVLILVLELNGASATVLNGLGGGLFVARVLHAWGLSGSPGPSFGRLAGTILTWLVIGVASGLAVYAHFA